MSYGRVQTSVVIALGLVAGCFYLPPGPSSSTSGGVDAGDGPCGGLMGCGFSGGGPGCAVNSDCPVGEVCDVSIGDCVQCVVDSECAAGEICFDDDCVIDEGVDAGSFDGGEGLCGGRVNCLGPGATLCQELTGFCDSNGCCELNGEGDAGTLVCMWCVCDDGTCANGPAGTCDDQTVCVVGADGCDGGTACCHADSDCVQDGGVCVAGQCV